MRSSRRQFIQASALATAGVALAGRRVFGQSPGWPPNLRKFVAPLPGIGSTGIPLATANTQLYPGTDFYRIVMGQYRQQMHPDLPARGTKLWGYADMTAGLPNFRYLGPAIVATTGKPVRVNFINLLPRIDPLPIDTSIPGAETGQQANRAAVHLHGGFVPWPSDGGPFHWFAPNGTHGPSLVKWLPNRLGQMTDDYWYPNAQSARLLWYHDHAVGITRLNAYAGLAAPYVLIDDAELRMFGPGGSLLAGQLPGIPLVLQDKSFKLVADAYGREGDLDYPVFYGAQEEHPTGGTFLPLPEPSSVPEFFSDNIVINGMAYPFHNLVAGAHRFRLLNGTQSRVFNLQLYLEDPAHPGEVPGTWERVVPPLPDSPFNVFVPEPLAKGPDFWVIGTEGGFLPEVAVVPSNGAFDLDMYYAHRPAGYGLVLAGAERADVLIDFSGYPVGTRFILYNDAGSPFPDGGDRNLDYYTGNPDGTGGPEGFGPNTRTMMRFEIVAGAGQQMPSLDQINFKLAGLNWADLPIPKDQIGLVFDVPPGAVHRIKTLSEGVDKYGRLIAMLGTDDVTNVNFTKHGMTYEQLPPENGKESYSVGDTEVWDIYNTTGDTHPIHFHLVNVQIIGRADFATGNDGGPIFGSFLGDWAPPDPDERGFKETVRMDPGQVTRVIMKIALPPDPVVRVFNRNKTVTVPTSPRTGGYEYVWHCHILEHEEHDMMRPFVVNR